MKQTETFGKWLVEFDLMDGARLNRLCYDGFELLTGPQQYFKPPSKDYGAYETRPVYGYDDCFPAVESSLYPGTDWKIPDHGELCWLEWDLECESNQLTFSVESKLLPVVFKRSMHFKESELSWRFEVINHGDKQLPFQHVMHPLLKLDEVEDIYLPKFREIWTEEIENAPIKNNEELSSFLLHTQEGDVYMFYLQNIEKGLMGWRYKNGLRVIIDFPKELFPTLGIWWNHSGYPDEDNCGRDECAFEPIAGPISELPLSHNKGRCQYVDANTEVSWEIIWSVKQDQISHS